jgi:hypothetical protein
VDIDYNNNKTNISNVLPEDALPSSSELQRDFEAITISHGFYLFSMLLILFYFILFFERKKEKQNLKNKKKLDKKFNT